MAWRIGLFVLFLTSTCFSLPVVDLVQNHLPEMVVIGGESTPILHRTSTCLGFLVAMPEETRLRDIDLWVEYEKPRDRSKIEIDKLRLTPSLVATKNGHVAYLLSLADDGCFWNSWKLFRIGTKLRLRLQYKGANIAGNTLQHPTLKYGIGYRLPSLFFQAVQPDDLHAYGYSAKTWPIPVEYDLCNAARKLGWDQFTMGDIVVDLDTLCSKKPLEASRNRPCQTLWFASYEDQLRCEPLGASTDLRVALGTKPRDGVNSALAQLARR